MKNIQREQKFIQLVLVLISLFIFIFFTRSYYDNLILNLDIKEEHNRVYKEKLEEANYLSKRQKELEKAMEWGKETKEYKEIKKYLEPISEDKIIEEIYSSVSNKVRGRIKVLSLTMWEWVENELGFMESKLDISLLVKSEETMKDLFDYLNNDSRYKIFINRFNMPKKANILGYKIQIPATIFYIETK